MALNRRATVLLVIFVVLATALAVKRLYLDRVDRTAQAPADTTGPLTSAGPTAAARAAAPVSAHVPEVNLAQLAAPRPAPEPAARDPFRFRPKAPPPPPPQPPPSTIVPTGPPPPPPVPPIPLRLRGFITKPGLKLSVWTDNSGNTFYGKEGDILDGRYRIVKIGVESADIAWADGRGRPERKTISGQ